MDAIVAGRTSPQKYVWLARIVPLMILPYLVAVAFVNGLLSPQWRTLPEDLAALDEFGLLPFYHHYIVSKAHAAEIAAIREAARKDTLSQTNGNESIDTGLPGDELNIFGESGMFYLVHHPLFSKPHYLLKSNAIRIHD